jgi:hypothetical protein
VEHAQRAARPTLPVGGSGALVPKTAARRLGRERNRGERTGRAATSVKVTGRIPTGGKDAGATRTMEQPFGVEEPRTRARPPRELPRPLALTTELPLVKRDPANPGTRPWRCVALPIVAEHRVAHWWWTGLISSTCRSIRRHGCSRGGVSPGGGPDQPRRHRVPLPPGTRTRRSGRGVVGGRKTTPGVSSPVARLPPHETQ